MSQGATLATRNTADYAGVSHLVLIEPFAGCLRSPDHRQRQPAEIKTAVLARGSHLMDLPGIGLAGAGRILADVGDTARFPSRAGNRRLNHVLHIAATVHMRHHDTPGRTPLARTANRRGIHMGKCSRPTTRANKDHRPQTRCAPSIVTPSAS